MPKTESDKPFVSIIITAYNEEKTIEEIIKDCKALSQIKQEIVVVIDPKTTDKTELVAKKLSVKTIQAPMVKNSGKGSTFTYALSHLKGDYVVQIDADHQFLPTEIPLLITPLLHGYDVTLGTRYQKGSHVEKGSVSLLKLIGSVFLSYITSFFISQRITDVMAGFKGFKKNTLLSISPQTNHFGYEAELVIKAKQKGYKIKNIPISYKKRSSGKSTVNSIKHGLLTLYTILKIGLRH